MKRLVLNNKNIWGFFRLWLDIIERTEENKKLITRLKTIVSTYQYLPTYKSRLEEVQKEIDNGRYS